MAVTYSTGPSQLCVGISGCGVAQQTIAGTVLVQFNPISLSTVEANPTTFGSFGELAISCVGGGTGCGSQSLAGLNLYININQTAPSGGSGSIPGGVISGSISGTASTAAITWSMPATTIIGGVTYSVGNNPLFLVPPSTNSGVTSIQAVITTVPLPAAAWLMLGGLAALGGLGRRRLS